MNNNKSLNSKTSKNNKDTSKTVLSSKNESKHQQQKNILATTKKNDDKSKQKNSTSILDNISVNSSTKQLKSAKYIKEDLSHKGSKQTLKTEQPKMPIEAKSKKNQNISLHQNDHSISKTDESTTFHQIPKGQPSKKGMKSQDQSKMNIDESVKNQHTDTLNKLKNLQPTSKNKPGHTRSKSKKLPEDPVLSIMKTNDEHKRNSVDFQLNKLDVSEIPHEGTMLNDNEFASFDESTQQLIREPNQNLSSQKKLIFQNVVEQYEEIKSQKKYLPLHQKNQLRAIKNILRMEEERQLRKTQHFKSNKKLKQIMNHVPNFQKMEEEYIQNVEIPMLERKKRQLVEIKQKNKPIPQEDIKKFGQQFDEFKEWRKIQFQENQQKYVQQPLSTFYRSRYYKNDQKSFNQSLIHNKPISSSKRRKDYSQDVQRRVHVTQDPKIHEHIEERKKKIPHRALQSGSIYDIYNKNSYIQDLKDQDKVQVDRKKKLKEMGNTYLKQFLDSARKQTKTANQTTYKENKFDSHNRQLGITRYNKDYSSIFKFKGEIKDEEYMQRKIDDILNNNTLNRFEKLEKIKVISKRFNDKLQNKVQKNQILEEFDSQLDDGKIPLMNIKAKLALLN